MKHLWELYWALGGNWKDTFYQSFCHPSALPSFARCWHFLGIRSLVFSKFWQGTRNPYEVVHDNRIFWNDFFCPKN